ncbi:MAG: type I-F CRISPR-associated protein Csy2 [Candidatus Marithrix sp.]
MATYIVFRNMEVINCTLSSSYLTADLSQNAYIGFAHNLARYLRDNLKASRLRKNKPILTLGQEQVFSIIKQLEFNKGYASLAGHLNDNNHKALNIPMNPPEIKGSLQHTIVIALASLKHDVEQIQEQAKKFVLFNRFAGGDIQVMADDNIKVYQNDKDLQAALKTEKGWLIQDASAELVGETEDSGYSKAFNNFLATFVKIDKDSNKQHKRRNDWYFASLAGYQLLEAPRKRIGTRLDCPHAFAEPIIGLHKLVYYRQQPFEELFWQAKMIDNTYLITQQHSQ